MGTGSTILKRDDNDEIRRNILDRFFTEREKMGYSKGSLLYLKKNAKQDKPFKVYGKVRRKLGETDDC